MRACVNGRVLGSPGLCVGAVRCGRIATQLLQKPLDPNGAVADTGNTVKAYVHSLSESVWWWNSVPTFLMCTGVHGLSLSLGVPAPPHDQLHFNTLQESGRRAPSRLGIRGFSDCPGLEEVLRCLGE